jgi:L-lactate dehydrogenase complex protein LldF
MSQSPPSPESTTSECHPHEVSLPYDMKPAADRATKNVQLQLFVNRAVGGKDVIRRSSFAEAFGDRVDAVRDLAGRIKQHTLDHLTYYLEQFIDRAEAVGWQVHFARDAEQANDIAVEIATRANCRLCVKSKSMVTEETRLVPRLEAVGVETVETDLGEFIIQLDDDAPSHIVAPMIHKDRAAVARAFVRELGAAYTEDPAELTMIARGYLREKFRTADLGISGGNFLVAETGSLVVCTNEGNGALSTSGPRVHVAMVGIEKLVPRMADLSVLLKVLARSSTGQSLTVYTHTMTGPRRPGDADGPEQAHVILVDNGRTEILRAETREMLRCIRCGACLNACPVYRKIGGHAYGAVYSGPIGALITPMFRGLENFKDLPHASSLCGACYEACPVKIDIPKQLIRLRREMVTRRITSWRERAAFRLWAWCLISPWRYRVVIGFQKRLLRWLGRSDVASADPCRDGRWIRRLGGPFGGWTCERDLPTPTSCDFRSWWKQRARGGRGGAPGAKS